MKDFISNKERTNFPSLWHRLLPQAGWLTAVMILIIICISEVNHV